MNWRWAAVISVIAASAVAVQGHAATLDLRGAVARVIVVTEPRTDIKATLLSPNPRLPLNIAREGDKVVVSGSPSLTPWWLKMFGVMEVKCSTAPDGSTVTVDGVGSVFQEQLPRLLIRMPLAARIKTSGCIVGSLLTANSLDLDIAGGDQWTIGRVSGAFDLHDSGSGHVRTGDLGRLSAQIAGSVHVTTHAISDGLDMHVAGVGGLHALQVSGPVDVQIAGQGTVNVSGGHATRFAVDIAGQGDVQDDGVADSLDVHIAGQGTVRVGKVLGRIDKEIAGQGSVIVGGIGQ